MGNRNFSVIRYFLFYDFRYFSNYYPGIYQLKNNLNLYPLIIRLLQTNHKSKFSIKTFILWKLIYEKKYYLRLDVKILLKTYLLTFYVNTMRAILGNKLKPNFSSIL